MKTGIKIILAALLTYPLWQISARAEDNSGLTNETDRVSYAFGVSVGDYIKHNKLEINVDRMMEAVKDVVTDQQPKLTEAEARQTMMAYQQKKRAEYEEEQHRLAETNRLAGEKFLAENKAKEGVKVIPVTLSSNTVVELQYKVLKEGDGDMPKPNDTVAVNYTGTLIDGKEFDSSAKRGQPAKFQVDRVIRGWTEALQHMKVGSKWQLFIPSELAYGDRGAPPNIPPGSTLIFDVELLDDVAPQPVTSDIIRVPSAEEMKKGAKPEIIKAADLEKKTAEQKKANGDK